MIKTAFMFAFSFNWRYYSEVEMFRGHVCFPPKPIGNESSAPLLILSLSVSSADPRVLAVDIHEAHTVLGASGRALHFDVARQSRRFE